ncbi:sulfite exporter TauE/SafE family protein, partial [Conchiformibius steedae]|uniref:sulfite exporter TauE/SafE family protein n=1 Tax=Conchiformibius steedae TaxID=153493 RepID=UPI0026F039DD
MVHETSLITLFILGFLGGTHCVGMCGGLSSAFALQLPPNVGRIRLIVLLNLGRIASYVLIGALMGALSQAGGLLDHTRSVQTVLLLLANVLLLLTGLYLAGLSRAAALVEHIGKPVWRRLNPVLNRLLP